MPIWSDTHHIFWISKCQNTTWCFHCLYLLAGHFCIRSRFEIENGWHKVINTVNPSTLESLLTTRCCFLPSCFSLLKKISSQTNQSPCSSLQSWPQVELMILDICQDSKHARVAGPCGSTCLSEEPHDPIHFCSTLSSQQEGLVWEKGMSGALHYLSCSFASEVLLLNTNL